MADTASKSDQPLDEVMLAMDVVDTLRHRDTMVERELSADLREDQLIKRLREIYHNQGIEVPDHILAEGVKALGEERFVYKPPEIGFSRTLAVIYINRGLWSKWLIGAFVAIALVFAGWFFLIEQPRRQAEIDLATELSTGLPKRIEASLATVSKEAKDDEALQQATAMANRGMTAAKSGKIDAARKAAGDLDKLVAKLRQTYEVVIVSRPGARSGVFRVPDVNKRTRNYYLIVEAIGRDGQVIPMEITSEEDQTTKTVSQWGLRVSSSVYRRVAEDKRRDGIVDEARVGVKQPGYLEPRWSVAVQDGRIHEW